MILSEKHHPTEKHFTTRMFKMKPNLAMWAWIGLRHICTGRATISDFARTASLAHVAMREDIRRVAKLSGTVITETFLNLSSFALRYFSNRIAFPDSTLLID